MQASIVPKIIRTLSKAYLRKYSIMGGGVGGFHAQNKDLIRLV